MSQPQGYTDFDAELNFQSTPSFPQQPQQGGAPPPAFDNFAYQQQQPPPPSNYGAQPAYGYSQPHDNFSQQQPQPASFAAFEGSAQPAWANNNPPTDPYYVPPHSGSYDNFSNQQQQPPPSFDNNPSQPSWNNPQEQHHQQGGENQQGQPNQQLPETGRHPITCAAHIIFKAAAVLCWFFISKEKFVPNFIAVVVLSAADFWVTKNVSGRLLVGLRWWNEIKEDGTNEWVFESLEGKRQVLPTETMLFWGALLGNTIAWAALAITQLFTFDAQFLLEAVIVFVLNLANLIGYFKSAREARKRVKGLATSMIMSHAVGYVAGSGQ